MSSYTAAAAASVPLPRRERDDPAQKSNRLPVWPIEASTNDHLIPLPARCARHSRANGICCRELKADDQSLVDPDIVRDVVIGLSDGLTVPFALAAGLSSLGESRLVVLGGIAELIAGAISMGIGGFLASQAERDHYRYLRKQTSDRVVRSCAEELEREVSGVLSPFGVDNNTCWAVAKNLREVEEVHENNEHFSMPSMSDTESGSLRWSKDIGLTAFLLKFGEGLEEVPTKRLYISAFTIGIGYLVGGIIPLLPYFFFPMAHTALVYSCIVTGIVLLVFGAIKARVTGAGAHVTGIVWGAVGTLLVGGLAAGAAFGIVRLLEGGSN